MFFVLLLVGDIAQAEPINRLERQVTVDMVPPITEPGTLEFVGCSKSCHEGVVTSEEQVNRERLIPADKTVVQTQGTWPLKTHLSMRDDLYYFALFGTQTDKPDNRRFSLRKHASESEPIAFEIGSTRISEQKSAGALPGSPPHRLEKATPPQPMSPDSSIAPPAVSPTGAPQKERPSRLLLGFLLAIGVGGLLGWTLSGRTQ